MRKQPMCPNQRCSGSRGGCPVRGYPPELEAALLCMDLEHVANAYDKS